MTGIVGRDRELDRLAAFVRGDGRALVLTGAAGIGKTTLWGAAVDVARSRGLRVLTARGEAEFALAGIGDLLERVPLDGLPQRRALEVALLRTLPGGAGPVEPLTIGLGLLGALRACAPVLVAIDDAQRLDAPSAAAIGFAARRLGDAPVRFLLARRSRPAPLERAIEPERLAVGPLDAPAIRALLAEQRLPRRVLRDIIDAARGNPLFALELARAVVERGVPEIGEPLELPGPAGALIAARVERLPPAIRRMLLAVALSPGVRAAELAAVGDSLEFGAALASGVLVAEGASPARTPVAGADRATPAPTARTPVAGADRAAPASSPVRTPVAGADRAAPASSPARTPIAGGDRVRVAHPLLGAAAIRHSRAGERRALHRALAAAVTDEARAARHLALATPRPDADLAATLAAAADAAAARGAVEQAAELARHAWRLTPADDDARAERVLALAERLDVAGADEQVTRLLVPALEWLPAGAPRVQAHLLLGDGGAVAHAAEHERHLWRALAEAGDDRALRAQVLARLATHFALVEVSRIEEASAWAREALRADAAARPAVGWTRILRGHGPEHLRDAASDEGELYGSVERLAAVRYVWRGQVAAARAMLTRLLALADERGEAWSYFVLRVHRCELELRAGNWDLAAALLDEWEQSGDGEPTVSALGERCRAHEAAGRGNADEAERWGAAALARAEATGMRWDGLEALRARGVAALLSGRPADAAEHLGAVWAHTERAGVTDPGAFPVAADLVEALVACERPDDATAVLARLHELAEEQRHPWARASVLRCRGLLDDPAALAAAASAYERLELRFDAARSWLLLGRAARRRRQWAASRQALESAAEAFDALGSPGWAAAARAELERSAGRRRGRLTPTERRAAELAAAGHTNEQIAQRLFIATHSVEVHLSRAYAKLDVRSRSQLAARLAG